MKRMVCLLCSGLFAALLFSCTNQLAGNGSEITNGYCFAAAGPADSAMVIAFPVDYIPCVQNPVMPETTFTDASGAFHMSLADMAWNLLIYDRTRQLGAFAGRRKGESAMGTIELDSLGVVAGTAASFALDISVTAFVGIAGSPFLTKVVRDSSFLINRVPPYSYQISLWMFSGYPITGDQPILVVDSVIAEATVRPGVTTSIIFNH